MAIDVACFEDPDRFRARVDGVVRQIRESIPAAGHDCCYSPGELEHETEIRYHRDGIPLSAATMAGLAQCD